MLYTCFFLFLTEFKFYFFIILVQVSNENIALFYVDTQYLLSQNIFEMLLNGSVQRSRSKLDIISFFCNKLLSFFCDLKGKAHIIEALHYAFHQDINYFKNVLLSKCIEYNHIVD